MDVTQLTISHQTDFVNKVRVTKSEHVNPENSPRSCFIFLRTLLPVLPQWYCQQIGETSTDTWPNSTGQNTFRACLI